MKLLPRHSTQYVYYRTTYQMMLLLGNAFKVSGYALNPPNTTLGVIGLDNMYKLNIIPTPFPSNIMFSEDGRKP